MVYTAYAIQIHKQIVIDTYTHCVITLVCLLSCYIILYHVRRAHVDDQLLDQSIIMCMYIIATLD